MAGFDSCGDHAAERTGAAGTTTCSGERLSGRGEQKPSLILPDPDPEKPSREYRLQCLLQMRRAADHRASSTPSLAPPEQGEDHSASSTRRGLLRVDVPAGASSASTSPPVPPPLPPPPQDDSASLSRRRLLRVDFPAGASSASTSPPAPPPLPPPPPHPAQRVPCNFSRILNHRIEPTLGTPAKSYPEAVFVCACFGGAIKVSKFSGNTMPLRGKLSNLLRKLLSCLMYCENQKN